MSEPAFVPEHANGKLEITELETDLSPATERRRSHSRITSPACRRDGNTVKFFYFVSSHEAGFFMHGFQRGSLETDHNNYLFSTSEQSVGVIVKCTILTVNLCKVENVW